MSDKRFFSPSTGGFYSEAIHGARKREAPGAKGGKPRLADNPDCTIPADAIEISAAEHEALFAAQAEGKAIVELDGRPQAVEPQPDLETIAASNRLRRNKALAASDWTQLPDSPLSETERAEWKAWRQELRELELTRPIADEEWPADPGGRG